MGYHRSFFGIGSITATNSDTYPTPFDIAIVRGATVEFKSTEKPLMGNKLFPVDSATTGATITGKIQAADFDARLVSLVIPGTSSATGQIKMASHAAAVPAPSGPYTITVTNSANWVTDLGVVNLTSGAVMTRAVSASAAGIYSVAAGVYTFHADDTGDSMVIRYTYNSAATGKTLTSTNQTTGATSAFGLRLFDPPGGTKENGIYFPAVKFSNLSLGLKLDDWTETNIDFQAFEDATGNLFYTYGNE